MTTRGETWRLFVAIELPETWLEALARHQEAVRRHFGNHRDISWSRPEGFHMTLKFIGSFDIAKLDALTSHLGILAADAPTFRMVLQSTYTFGGRPFPRIYAARYVAPNQMEELESVHRRLDAAFVELGVPNEGRRFLPHVTLARIRPGISRQTYEQFAAAIHSAPLLHVPSFETKQFSLMRSHLGPGGARYERIAAFPEEI